MIKGVKFNAKNGMVALLIIGCLGFIFSGFSLSPHYIVFSSPDKGAHIIAFVTPPGKSGMYGDIGTYYIASWDSISYLKSKNLAEVKIEIQKNGYRSKICYIPGPFSDHNKLPALIPYPAHKTGQRNMYIENVCFNLNKDSMVTNRYRTGDDFKNGKIFTTNSNTGIVAYKDGNAAKTMNEFLITLNYIDTATRRKLSFLDYNWLKVYPTITKVCWNSVNDKFAVDITCSWKIMECLTGRTLCNHTIISRSNWGLPSDSLLADAYMQGLFDFLSDSVTAKGLIGGKTFYRNIVDKWDTLTISHGNEYAGNIQQAINAGVTIKLPHGHGSGCVISSDGYIVTNCHIAGSDTALYTIIFHNRDVHKARLIRSNPLVDLVLLKVDTLPSNIKPLKIAGDDSFGIGTEAYAIGTPEDMELGQTLTKGVVSAIRVIDDMKYIQTDVSISPGSSGGAFITKDGSLIGIVRTKIIKEATSGLGFAIPIDYLQKSLKLKIL